MLLVKIELNGQRLWPFRNKYLHFKIYFPATATGEDIEMNGGFVYLAV